MSKVEKHPYDEGKYQSTFDDYGHGKGNGKSRNAIYKHAKKLENLDFRTGFGQTQDYIIEGLEKAFVSKYGEDLFVQASLILIIGDL